MRLGFWGWLNNCGVIEIIIIVSIICGVLTFIGQEIHNQAEHVHTMAAQEAVHRHQMESQKCLKKPAKP